ncbi:hypothetical protein Bbelb_200540, partial [Branchiostoma belcheri]
MAMLALVNTDVALFVQAVTQLPQVSSHHRTATPADCEETTARGSRSRHRVHATDGHSRDRAFILTSRLQGEAGLLTPILRDGSDSASVQTTSPTHASLPTPAPGRVTTSSRSIELKVLFWTVVGGGSVLVLWQKRGKQQPECDNEDKRERRKLRPTGDTRDGEHNIERLICPSFDGTFFNDVDVLVFPKISSKLFCRSFFRDRRALSTRRLSASLPEASADDGRPRRISRGHIRTNVPSHRQPAD